MILLFMCIGQTYRKTKEWFALGSCKIPSHSVQPHGSLKTHYFLKA